MKKLILTLGICIFTLGVAMGQVAGDLIITEVMADPNDVSDTQGEYFEIYNATNDSIDIGGFKISDASNTHVISGTVIVPPKTFFTLAEESDSAVNGGVSADYDYPSSITLNNTSETLTLATGSDVTITTISYTDGNLFGVGVAMELSNLSDAVNGTILEGDLIAATSEIDGPGDLGSPGSQGNTLIDITIISGTAGWRMLSFPISGGAAEDISDDTAIQGVSGGDNPDSTSNFVTYDNTGAYETPALVSTNIGNGYGFITYFYNNTDAGSSTLPITLQAFGTEPSSDVSVDLNVSTLESGSYYTMVGNPYASNFDLSSITASVGSIQNYVAFWNNGTGSYSAQNITDPYIVAPWQGFWVETTSASVTAISMPTSGKTATAASGTFFSKENPEEGDLKFTLTSENTFDEAIRLSVRANASLGYDLDDASKFTPLTDPFATMAFVGEVNSEEKLQSVFSIPSQLEEEIIIPLKITNLNSSGEFTFAWSEMESMPQGWDFELIDYDTGNSVSLRSNESYTFEVDEVQAKSTRTVLAVASTLESDEKASRFGLIITPGISVGIDDEINEVTEFKLDQNYPNPFNPSTTIKYSVGEAGPVNITIYNVMGQKVAEILNTTRTAGNYQVTWNATAQASGIYYYRLTAPGQVLTRQMTLIK